MDPHIFRVKFLEMQETDADTTEFLKKNLKELSNISIDSELEENPFSLLI